MQKNAGWHADGKDNIKTCTNIYAFNMTGHYINRRNVAIIPMLG